MKAVLGVDGGNTKTDYLLHDLSGKLLSHLRAGTCSHEVLGMDGARREMETRIEALLLEAGVAKEHVAASAFGLAGVDQRVQQAALLEVVHAMGFTNTIVMNDSFLGIKAGSESGVGISSINGTGTAAGGIDRNGMWMQVGGMGANTTGDKAGGSYIAENTIGAVYDEIYRFGAKTELTPRLLTLFKCEAEDFHTAMSLLYKAPKGVSALDILRLLFGVCDGGDAVARGLVERVGQELARSAAGCAVRLSFGDTIPVVLIGSVWTRGRNPVMIDAFRARFEAITGKVCDLRVLDVPPAAGSVLWALELARGGVVPSVEVRGRVLEELREL